MKNFKNLLLLVTILVFISSSGYTQTWETTSKKETHYFQIALGYGVSYGGVGANLMYRANNVVFHAGVGAGFYPISAFYTEYDVNSSLLYGGGIKFYFAKSNDNFFTSWYIDAQYGLNGVDFYYDPGISDFYEEQVNLHGPSVLVGYDFNFGGKGGRVGGSLGLGGSYAVNKDYNISKFLLAIDWGLTIRIN
jgi:hypothetical protein